MRHNFTQAQLPQLLAIRSAASHRIYWLVKEYAQQGKTHRDVTVSELRHVLGLTTEYVNRFDHFKTRVLDRAQAELALTDLPITLEFIRRGKAVHTIRFRFAATVRASPGPTPDAGSWQALLLQTGISGKSLASIQAKLEAGDYAEGYIPFVVRKVQRPAGAVFKALTKGYLLPAYEKLQQPKPVRPKHPHEAKPKFTKSGTSLSGARKRLSSELEDAYGSLNFVTSSEFYTAETRPAAIQEVQATIHRLQQQLAQLGAS